MRKMTDYIAFASGCAECGGDLDDGGFCLERWCVNSLGDYGGLLVGPLTKDAPLARTAGVTGCWSIWNCYICGDMTSSKAPVCWLCLRSCWDEIPDDIRRVEAGEHTPRVAVAGELARKHQDGSWMGRLYR